MQPGIARRIVECVPEKNNMIVDIECMISCYFLTPFKTRITMRGQKVYKQILDSLMSSVHRLGPGEQYDYGRVYTDNEKRQVTPEELMRWLNIRTFGVPDPGPQLAIRPLVRANTVAFWKKSYFILYARSFAWLENRFK